MAPIPTTPTQPAGHTASATAPTGSSPRFQPLGEVVVENVPERLSNLTRSVLLTGMIAERKEGGALIVRTQVGELTIRSQTPLPQDKILALQIPPGAPPVRAQIALISPMNLPDNTQAMTGRTDNTGTAGAQPPSAVPAKAAASAPAGPEAGTTATKTTSSFSPSTATTHLSTTTATQMASLAAEVLPVLPGSVTTAQIQTLPTLAPQLLAKPLDIPPLPQPASPPQQAHSAGTASVQSQASIEKNTPLAQSTQQQVSSNGSPAALNSLMPNTLQELIARLPPSILSPAAHPGDLSPSQQRPAGTLSAMPGFSGLPNIISLPAGSSVTIQIERIILPGGQERLAPAITPAAATAASPSTSAPAGAPAAAPGGNIQAPGASQSPVAATAALTRQTTPQSAATTTAPPASATTSTTTSTSPPPLIFPALVTGHTPQGQPIITSPAGLLVMGEKTSSLPTGTQLEVSLINIKESTSLTSTEETSPLPPKPTDWPELQQLAAQVPQRLAIFQQSLSNPSNVGTQLLFLLAALGLRDIKNLVGEELTERLLQAGQHEKLTRLSAEMQTLGQSWMKLRHGATQASPQEGTAPPHPSPAAGQQQQTEWKSLSIPLPPDSQILRLAVHLRDDHHHEQEEKKGTSESKARQHLVIEIELSRLGPMVFDGTITHKQKHFDLTLRTQRLLSRPLRQELQSVFIETLKSIDWRGSMKFRTAAEIWLQRQEN